MTEPQPDPIADALRLRASDADRERVAGLLRDAYAEGRLSHVEHDERLTRTYAATTYADLVPILQDLPVPPGAIPIPGAGQVVAVTGPALPVQSEGGMVVVDPSRASQAVGHAIAVMSGVERKGRWVVPETSNAVAIMGGIEMDLSDAVLTAHTTEITILAVMGGVDVKVPEGIDVRIDVFGFMGGSSGPQDTSAPGSPTIVFKGLALMGGLNVERPKRKKNNQIGR
ncbi:MAG TPA: DUF1707 domain-containing protein [Candidatus Nanopelagicales bacterium]|nr:DUF1707 domain-containing protein [Candidatus Nanopelagicales bacterium]